MDRCLGPRSKELGVHVGRERDSVVCAIHGVNSYFVSNLQHFLLIYATDSALLMEVSRGQLLSLLCPSVSLRVIDGRISNDGMKQQGASLHEIG